MRRPPTLRPMIGLCLLVALWGALGCTEPVDRGSLRIGLLIHEKHFGVKAVIDAAHLAVDEINHAGGLELSDGERVPVELRLRTSFLTPEQAVESIRELIYQEAVHAVVGPAVSRNAIPAAAVAESVGVPLISPGSTHPETTAGKRWAFRMTVVDDAQGMAMARFALEDLGASTAAVLYNEAEPFSRNLAAVFQRAVVVAGGEVVAVESYGFNDLEVGPQMERIHSRRPDVLFLPSSQKETLMQARAAHSLGLDAVLLGCDAWTVSELPGVPELVGAFAFQHWHHDLAETKPETARFVRLFQERYGTAPSDAAALSWDAIGLIAAAARGGLSAQGIRDGLASITGFKGASGTITFAGHGGDPPKAAVIVRIEQDRVALHKILEAADGMPGRGDAGLGE